MKILTGFLLIILPLFSFSQSLVMGKITDNDGNPLPEVKVLVKNCNITTYSDKNGNFALRNLPSEASTIIFEKKSYKSVEEPINHRIIINVKLKDEFDNPEDIILLEEMEEVEDVSG